MLNALESSHPNYYIQNKSRICPYRRLFDIFDQNYVVNRSYLSFKDHPERLATLSTCELSLYSIENVFHVHQMLVHKFQSISVPQMDPHRKK